MRLYSFSVRNYFLLSHDRGGSRAVRNLWSFSSRRVNVILSVGLGRVTDLGLGLSIVALLSHS
jgi:hypothetical protein